MLDPRLGDTDAILPHGAERQALLARWLTLTRDTLPGMARQHGWPISLDHCFMRVCLDHTIGQRWDQVVRRPAMRYLGDAQLRRAVDIAEQIVRKPALLAPLNRASLHMRRRCSTSGA